MTYLELIRNAEYELNFNKITLGEYEEMIKPLKREIEQHPCDTPRNNLEITSQDCISRKEALKYSHIEYDDDGVGHRVIYAEDIEKLSPVTPTSDASVLDEIIAKIEQTRDKDKIAEYPYNRCIRIIEKYKNGE